MAWRLHVRDVAEEFEAHLTGAGNAKGKAERKRYANGDERLKVRGSGLSPGEVGRVEIVIGGTVVAWADLKEGRFRFDINGNSATAPIVRAGETIEVRAGGRSVLTGVFHPE